MDTLFRKIKFKIDNQPIKAAFAFGGTDSDAHLYLLKEIAKWLLDDDIKNMLTGNASKQEIADKLNAHTWIKEEKRWKQMVSALLTSSFLLHPFPEINNRDGSLEKWKSTL